MQYPLYLLNLSFKLVFAQLFFISNKIIIQHCFETRMGGDSPIFGALAEPYYDFFTFSEDVLVGLLNNHPELHEPIRVVFYHLSHLAELLDKHLHAAQKLLHGSKPASILAVHHAIHTTISSTAVHAPSSIHSTSHAAIWRPTVHAA